MTNEELLQKTLNSTIERLGKQSMNYEVEIANLNSQIILLASQVEELRSANQVDIFDPPLFVED
jgi:prefoldin subunit 5